MKNYFKKLFDVQDMTYGPIWRRIAAFAIPLLIGNVVQQLYNTVDAVVVGRYVGDEALAAVGASGPIMFLVLVFFMGISTGTGIMVSQYFGARDRSSLSKTIGTTITLMLITSALIMVLGPLITRPLLALIKTPDNIIDQTAQYLMIIFIGITGIAFYNGISGILRGMGDALMPLAFLTITCLMNIALDIWFVAGLGWGVAGAAWATVISQWISAVLCLMRLLRKNDAYELKPAMLKIDKTLALQMGRLGLPAAATQIVFSLANILIQALINQFGSDYIASQTIVMRVDAFAVMPIFSFGMAMSTFTGQNVGAGKLDRVEKGVRTGLLMGVSITAFLDIMMFLFGRYLMQIFTDTRHIIDMGYTILRILLPGYLGFSAAQIFFGAIRGAGDTVSSMWISMVTTVAIRTPLAYLLAWITRSPEYPVGRPEVIPVTLMLAWLLSALFAGLVYRAGRWRTKGLITQPAGSENGESRASQSEG